MSRSTTTSPTITPQMSVLGRDGRDLNVGYHETPFLLNCTTSDGATVTMGGTSSSTINNNNNYDNNKSSEWWGSWKLPLTSASTLIHGGGGTNANGDSTNSVDDDNDQHDDAASYTSMGEIHDRDKDEEHNNNNNSTKPASAILRSMGLFHPTTTTSPPNQQQLLLQQQQQVRRGHDNAVFSSVASDDFVNPPAKEEAVRNDCSFFYQDLEEHPSAMTTRSTTALGSPTTLSGSAYYNPLMSTPPRHRAAYRARFQQLNEEWRRHSDIYDDDNELWLHDEDDAVAAAVLDQSTTLSVSNVLHSSLCWAQGGRILMTLPKDKVRLLMDDDLEPGILSVERADTNHNNNNNKDELMYVLTVDENLYRRVIGEISDATSSRFGLHQFCIDEGRVDISVAVMCLVLVLLILLINTIIWPGD